MSRRVSVVMPVRDAGPYLEDCLRSILGQTYRDFEFIIRDDGSVDGSTGILRRWAARDQRIRLFVGKRSLGPAESSNWVMRKTQTTYVARMDADDIAHPDRLRRQLAVLDSLSRRLPGRHLVGRNRRPRPPGSSARPLASHSPRPIRPLPAWLDHDPARRLRPGRRLSQRLRFLGGCRPLSSPCRAGSSARPARTRSICTAPRA